MKRHKISFVVTICFSLLTAVSSHLFLNTNAFAEDATAKSFNGIFHGADEGHKGKGSATIEMSGSGKHILRLTNFETTNGPDLEVWLVKASPIVTKDDVTSSQWLSLGALKRNLGDQEYAIPTDANLEDYKSVVIWCKAFSVLFAAAELAPRN